MSFIESVTGLQAPSEVARFIDDVYPFCDQTTRDDWNGVVREHTAKVARRLHDAVTQRVASDPATLALADQFEAELLDTAKRGRRG